MVQWYTQGTDKVSFLDVGQGDAVLIMKSERCVNVLCFWAEKVGVIWYNRQVVVVDSGPDDAIIKQLGYALPWWKRTIDLVVISHPHQDHISGVLLLMERYRVRSVIINPVPHRSTVYAALVARLTICHQSLRTGSEIVVDREAEPIPLLSSGDLPKYFPWLQQVHPIVENEVLWDAQQGCWNNRISSADTTTVNNDSVVLLATLGKQQASVLLTGDIEAKVERRLVTQLQNSTHLKDGVVVLKGPHQCSRSSSTPEFIALIRPQQVVCSVGKNNRYGHPHQEVIARYLAQGATVHRTDKEGTVTFTFPN